MFFSKNNQNCDEENGTIYVERLTIIIPRFTLHVLSLFLRIASEDFEK